MHQIVDAFWRAALYLFRPRIFLVSLLPLAAGIGVVLLLGWLYWEGAVAAVRETLQGWSLLDAMLKWVDTVTGASFRAVFAPMVVVALAVPVVVAMSLLMVTLTVTPVIVGLVSRRRFPHLERRVGAGFWASTAWSLACTIAALALQAASAPLWLIPPLVLILPPLIWGWLACRVLAFDALAVHADAAERRQLMISQRWPLLAMGVVCGYLGALPSLLWVSSAATLMLAPVLLMASVWLYTLVFVFAALWFVHFCLAALNRIRDQAAAAMAGPVVSAAPAPDGEAAPLRSDFPQTLLNGNNA
jgi:hypothetical protein